MLTTPFRTLVLAAACLLTGAAAQAQTLLSEGFEAFDDLAAAGWVTTNASTPAGSLGFFAGQTGVFSAQAGTEASYAAANFNSAAAGGTIDNWLITPSFSTALPVIVRFWARAAAFAPYVDQIRWGTSTGSSTTADFTMGSAVTLGGEWTQFSLSLPALGAGSFARLAIQYTGQADDSDFIGIDSVSVTAVPEPATALLLLAGVAGLGELARRRSSQTC